MVMHATNRNGSLVLNSSKSRRKSMIISRTQSQPVPGLKLADLDSLKDTNPLGFLRNFPARSRKSKGHKGQQISTHAPVSGQSPPRPGFASLRKMNVQVPVPKKTNLGRQGSSSSALFAAAFCGNLVHKTRILLDTSKQIGSNTVFDTMPTLQQSRKQARAHNDVSTTRTHMLKFSSRRRRQKSAHVSKSQKASVAHKQDLASQMTLPTLPPEKPIIGKRMSSSAPFSQPIMTKQMSFPAPPPDQPTTAHNQDLASQMTFPTLPPDQRIATNQTSFPAQLPDEVVRRRRVESAHGLALLATALGAGSTKRRGRRSRTRIRTEPSPKSNSQQGSRRRASFMAIAKKVAHKSYQGLLDNLHAQRMQIAGADKHLHPGRARAKRRRVLGLAKKFNADMGNVLTEITEIADGVATLHESFRTKAAAQQRRLEVSKFRSRLKTKLKLGIMSRQQLEKSLQAFQHSNAKSALETSEDFAQTHHMMACDVIMHAIDKKIDLKQKVERGLFAAHEAQDADALARLLREHAHHLNLTATAQEMLALDGEKWLDAVIGCVEPMAVEIGSLRLRLQKLVKRSSVRQTQLASVFQKRLLGALTDVPSKPSLGRRVVSHCPSLAALPSPQPETHTDTESADQGEDGLDSFPPMSPTTTSPPPRAKLRQMTSCRW